jgi:hypothetical protein
VQFTNCTWTTRWLCTLFIRLDSGAVLDEILAHPSPHFPLYVTAALLVNKREEFLTAEQSFESLYVAAVSKPSADVWEQVLTDARVMCELFTPVDLLSADILDILC